MTAPTAARRQLGKLLDHLRTAAGVSAAEAAHAIRGSESKIRRIERGAVTLKERDLTDLLKLYRASNEEHNRARDLFENSSEGPAWWGRYSDQTPEWFRQFLGFEHAATSSVTYETMIVPTLLQTSGYSTAAIAAAHDDRARGRRWVDLHLERQRRLMERSTPHTFYIEETAITRSVGNDQVQAEQALALASFLDSDNITVRVVPHVMDSWLTLTGPFVFFGFADSVDDTVPPVIYHEHLTGSQFFGERENEVAEYNRILDRLDKLARSREKSATWLREYADSLVG